MRKIHPRHFHIREHFMSWAGISTILLVLLIINAAYISNRVKAENPLPTPRIIPNSNKILSSLQTDETSAYTVTVKDVTENASVDHAFTIDPSHTMLIMDISITNHTSSKQDLIPVNQLYIRDREGDTFTMHPSSLLKEPLAATTLVAGQTVKGQLSFDVPKKLANPLLYVDFGWDNLAPTVIDVLR